MLKQIKNKKFIAPILLVAVFVVFFSFWPADAVFASGAMDKIFTTAKNVGISIILFIVNVLISLVGKILVLLIKILVMLALYNDFIYNPYVQKGWVIVRDIVNMFFILGLLLIAFATVLKIEKFSYNKLLGRLLIMAIIVNFSRTICGIIIDFFQVIMITFVKSFKDITGGNLMKGFGTESLWQADTSGGAATSTVDQGIQAVVGSIFGLIFVIIATIVVAIFCMMLAIRIVALWILIVFSPLAFFSWVFEPAGGKIASLSQQWFGEFFKYCMVGPFLAFFLWMALISMSTVSAQMTTSAVQGGMKADELNKPVEGLSAVGNAGSTIGFVMGIAMLVGGLYFTGQMGVIGANYAKGGVTAVRKGAERRVANMARRTGAAAKGVAMAPARGGVKLAKIGGKLGAERMQMRGGKLGRLAYEAQLATSKEGRQVLKDRGMAMARAKLGGQPGARAEQLQKELKSREGLLRKAGADKDPNVMKKLEKQYKKSGDKDNYMALMNIKAAEGKIEQSDFQNAVKMGAFDRFGHVEHLKDKNGKRTGKIDTTKTSGAALIAMEQVGKEWEKAFEDQKGFRASFSPIVRDPITNDWEVVEGQRGQELKAKDSESSISRGRGEKLGKAANSGQVANLESSTAMEAFSHLVGFGKNDAHFRMVGDTGLANVKKRNDEFTQVLTSNLDDKSSEGYKVLEKAADKKKLTGQEKVDFIDKRKQEVNDLKQSAYFKDNAQHLVTVSKTSSGKYEAGTGKEREAGQENQDLKNYLQGQGIIPTPPPPPTPTPPPAYKAEIDNFVDKRMSQAPSSAKSAAKNFVTEKAGDILHETEGLDQASRQNKIAKEIEAKTALRGQEAKDMADIIIKMETPMKETRDKVSPNLDQVVKKVKDEWDAGSKDAGKVDMRFNVVIQQLKNEASSHGLTENSYQARQLKQAKDDLLKELAKLNATDASINKAIDKFQATARNLGYNVGKK